MNNESITPDEPFLRVSASSNPQSVASAIAHAIYDKKEVKLRAVGAGAVNQAVKEEENLLKKWMLK